MYGWVGKILRIDLTQEKIATQSLDPNFARLYFGSRGFHMRILYDEFDPEIKDPFDPGNIICVGSGVLAGTLAPSSGRVNVSVGLSPLTHGFGDGNAGGFFGPELKFAGFDDVVITGKARKPVYLWINDDIVEIRDASQIWGKDVYKATKMIQDETDLESSVFAIGPAGEKRVAIACPVCNMARAPGANGMGAVFGSKNLKAICVRGTQGIKVADVEGFSSACREAMNQITTHPIYVVWKNYGTTVLTGIAQQGGGLPTRNWQESVFDRWEDIDGPAFLETFVEKHKGCFNCPLSCSRFYRVYDGPYKDTYGEGPEYEAVDGFGANCGISNKAAILRANQLCNMYGLCVVQTSHVVSTCMHLWQEKIIDEQDTDGIILEWGNDNGMIKLIEQIGTAEGFGAIFVDGIISGVRKIAKCKALPERTLERYVIHTKGMTYPSTEPRPLKGSALSLATSTRGGDHLRGLPTIEMFANWYGKRAEDIVKFLGVPREIAESWIKLGLMDKSKYEGKSVLVKYYQDQCAAADALGVCKFITSWRFGVGPSLLARQTSALTGYKYDWKDVLEVGDRIFTLEYAMQRRFGFTRKDDYPPERMFEEPLPSGPEKGTKLHRDKYEGLLSEYYMTRGFDEQGFPTRKKLEQLRLKDVADDLERRNLRAR